MSEPAIKKALEYQAYFMHDENFVINMNYRKKLSVIIIPVCSPPEKKVDKKKKFKPLLIF